MAGNTCEINLKDGTSSKNNLKRNNYFKGKLLSAEDFIAEQNYLSDKIRKLSAQVNGYGVIEGFKVENISQKRHVTIGAGSAVDTSGNLYMLTHHKTYDLPREIQKGDYIYFKYLENPVELLSVQNDEECSDECCYNKIEETFEVMVSSELLVAEAADICTLIGKGKYRKLPLNKKYKKLPLNITETMDSVVLIAQYNDKGGFDYEHVPFLHKNSELSKLVCKISKRYVSSVNGNIGDISAVASLNNATPDDDGHVNLVAGNNISIRSQGHDVTIAASNGFYHDYYVTLAPDTPLTIDHNAKRFPVVDIYKRELSPVSTYYALKDTELQRQARDTMKPFETLKEELNAMPLEDFISNMDEKGVTSNISEASSKDTKYDMQSDTKMSSTASNYLQKSRKKVSDELVYSFGVTTLSPQVMKLSDMELAKVIDVIYVIPNYQYKKIVGSQDNELNIEVTHLNTNTLKLTNKTGTEIPLLVIVST